MFFSDPALSLKLMLFCLAIALVLVLVLYWKTKNILLSLTVASLFGQFIVHDNVDYRFSVFFNVMWLFEFSLYIWPYINIGLVVITVLDFVRRKFMRVLQD